MSLTVGSRLGSHEILGLLGAGGMGEVFLAQDTKLKRRVAIKVLPGGAAAEPDRLARFHREAQAVAALNHPGIAAIYDLAEAGGITFLVLELVEGDTLAEKLRGGALPVDDAVAIARQILKALEAAHDKGICHRDLKPANIKVTPDGVVKILDFGLARFLERGPTADTQTTVGQTSPGAILGTPGYMSPEQAKGLDADERSDIFSFGCVWYELLTGRPAFAGATASEAMASVLMADADFDRLPPAINPRLVEILARCLDKNPKQRWHAAADVRLQLEAMAGDASVAAPRRPAPLWTRAVTAAAAVSLAALTGYASWALKPEPTRPVTRFSISLPDGQQFSLVGRPVLAMSPDGGNLVYVANRRLYLRPMFGTEARVIPGSYLPDGVQIPVISPDGQSVAFRSVGDGTLKWLPLSGGAPVTICPMDTPFGLSWSEDGLLFGQLGKGILRVSPDGGVLEVIIPVPAEEMADSPQLLPGRKAVLFSVKKLEDSWDNGQVVVQGLNGGARKTIIEGGAAAVYVPSGHLIYAVASVLFAIPFDLNTLAVSGGAVSIVEGIDRGFQGPGANRAATAHYVVSSTGSLVFVPGSRAAASAGSLDLALFDRKGVPRPLGLPPAPYAAPRASPDGKWAAVERGSGAEVDIWLVELAGASPIRRLTFGGKNRAPAWSSDSHWVVFQSDQDGGSGIFRQRADGAGTAERLTTAEAGALHIPQSGAQLSFVQPFPATAAKYEIPGPKGAARPVWTSRGDAILVGVGINREALVPVATTPQFSFGRPEEFSQGARLGSAPSSRRNYDPLSDDRILGVMSLGAGESGGAAAPQVAVVLNWSEELKRLAPRR